MATTTANKRTISDASIDGSNPSKKRKLNDDVCNSTSSSSIKNEDKKNDNTAKSNKSNNDNNDDNNNDDNNNDDNNNKSKNNEISNWSFKASDFTFGNSWTTQTSNNETKNESKELKKIAKSDTNDSVQFAKFEGLGFEQVLANENSKDDKKESDGKQEDKNGWGSAWSNSNPDGTFKLNFDWGSWENSKTKIDLNPSTSVGWESQATNFDPNTFEEDDKTKKVLEKMTGQQDSGDKNDDTKCKIRCKIYNLESGKYVERGQGVVKINTYKLKNDNDNDNDNNDDKDTKTEQILKGRILCRRDQILTTLINAPILKEMKFEKVGNFIRFGVVELKKKNNENENENKNENGEKNEKNGNKKHNKKNKKKDDKDSKDNKKVKEENDKTEEGEEDNDMETEIKTYLMKPINKAQIDTLLDAITEIQKLV